MRDKIKRLLREATGEGGEQMMSYLKKKFLGKTITLPDRTRMTTENDYYYFNGLTFTVLDMELSTYPSGAKELSVRYKYIKGMISLYPDKGYTPMQKNNVFVQGMVKIFFRTQTDYFTLPNLSIKVTSKKL